MGPAAGASRNADQDRHFCIKTLLLRKETCECCLFFFNESQSLEGRQPVSHPPSYAGTLLNCKGKALCSPRSLPLETAFPLAFALSDSRPRTGVRRRLPDGASEVTDVPASGTQL